MFSFAGKRQCRLLEHYSKLTWLTACPIRKSLHLYWKNARIGHMHHSCVTRYCVHKAVQSQTTRVVSAKVWMLHVIVFMYVCSTGYKSSRQPELKLDGYAFNPLNLYRTGVPALTVYNPHNPWPKTDIRTFPTWRGPRAYYGFYHEELDVHQNGGYRYPRDPRVLVNDEDIAKYEYMRNMPHCHQKLPVEFPVLM